MLLFDAGNSRCKWAWIENEIWLRQGVLDNADNAAWVTLQLTFATLPAPKKILVSNVAGKAAEQRLRALCNGWNVPVEMVVASAKQCGVRNGYAQAAQLGSDRWAALIAARHRVKQACLVVNCGTATTVDALTENGEFLGGIIIPGLSVMRRSLLSNTDLPTYLNVDLPANVSLHDFPDNTQDAIATGVIRASLGVIQQQYDLLAETAGAHCIVSGGAAHLIVKHLTCPAEQVENLVLQGMKMIGQQ